MRFQPSAYSDVAASAPPAGAGGGVSADAASSVVRLGTEAVGMGLDAWQARSDAKMDKWRKLAAKKARKAKALAAARQQAAMPAAPAPMPLAPVPAAAPNPWVKWGLIGAGVLIVGVLGYLALRKKDEPHKPKHNPKRVFIKAPPKPRVTNVRPAATEIPSSIEIEENPADDDDGGGYTDDDGGDYGDAEESE